MAAQGQSGGGRQQEITVVVNRDRKKKMTIMQLPNELGFDKNTNVTLARENNLKEYKSAYNIDTMPTTGAGSEFGREAKEEARRRKYGYIRKKYNPEAQPWLMQAKVEKTPKKLKGTRNGGILENASYFIFTRKPEGVFEATPVEEWYNFKPTVSYKSLDADEAEEEFARRDKNLNLFNIMVRKRLKKEEEDSAADDKAKVKAEIKSKGLMLTEMDDWADMSDEDERDNPGHDSDDSINGKKVGKKGAKGKSKAQKKREEKDSDEEALEESDDGDMEAKQVDYMSDTSESDSDVDLREDKTKYEQKGVEDEDGLRDIVVESEDEKDTKQEEKEEKGSEKSSSSSESESDDPDKEDNDFTKAFLMTGSKKERGKSPVPRSTTPTDDKKRKMTSSPSSSALSPLAKKVKQEPTNNLSSLSHNDGARPSTPINASSSASRDGLTEETVKRYLMRKPMSSKDLCKIFKSKKLGLSSEQLTVNIANILRKLKTTQQKINGIVHFSINE